MPSPALIVLGALLVVALVGVGFLFEKLRSLQVRYAGIPGASEEIARLKAEAARTIEKERADATRDVDALKKEAETLRRQREEEVDAAKARREALDADYAKAKAIFDRLTHELSLVEENLEDISFGLYKPHFTFETPDEYKKRLEEIRDQQKEMLRKGQAISFAVAWSVGGSRRDGERMQKQYGKLMLRAFNGECDAAVAKVSWSNFSKMEERIRRALDAVNEVGSVMQVAISPAYLELKLSELRLEYELEEKKYRVLEEQRRIREQMREEERAQRELEQAEDEAQADEARFEKALERARVELAKTRGEEHQRLNEKLLELQQQLDAAKARKDRARAMAELTRAGYVYIISNVGSFGEDIFKIGMTRRLDPMERVRELASASVPFPFDVHAMVYSDDAPALENDLHKHFETRLVNLVNRRKEFFRVTLDELDSVVTEKGLKVFFTRLAEAREYRQTLATRSALPAAPPPKVAFPSQLPHSATA